MSYKRIEQYDEKKTARIENHIRSIIKEIDPDPDRQGLIDTPKRFAKAIQFLNHGYSLSSDDILSSALFTSNTKEMVVVKDIELYSLCEHHLLPFFGKAHIAYIPNGNVVGLSKLARIVDVFSRRLQIQERLTNQILSTIHDTLKPLGVAIIIEAKHSCMMMRGVEKQNSVTTTSAFIGEFEKPATRNEFMNVVSKDLI